MLPAMRLYIGNSSDIFGGDAPWQTSATIHHNNWGAVSIRCAWIGGLGKAACGSKAFSTWSHLWRICSIDAFGQNNNTKRMRSWVSECVSEYTLSRWRYAARHFIIFLSDTDTRVIACLGTRFEWFFYIPVIPSSYSTFFFSFDNPTIFYGTKKHDQGV